MNKQYKELFDLTVQGFLSQGYEIYKQCDWIVTLRRWKLVHQTEDLKVLETIRKYPSKPYPEVFKLSNLAVSWRLRDLYGKAKDYVTTVDVNDEEQEDKFYVYNENLTHKYLKDAEKSHQFHFEELLSVLDDEEYEILSKVVRQNNQFKTIAINRGVSSQYIQKVYHRAVGKAKKYLYIKP